MPYHWNRPPDEIGDSWGALRLLDESEATASTLKRPDTTFRQKEKSMKIAQKDECQLSSCLWRSPVTKTAIHYYEISGEQILENLYKILQKKDTEWENFSIPELWHKSLKGQYTDAGFLELTENVKIHSFSLYHSCLFTKLLPHPFFSSTYLIWFLLPLFSLN